MIQVTDSYRYIHFYTSLILVLGLYALVLFVCKVGYEAKLCVLDRPVWN